MGTRTGLRFQGWPPAAFAWFEGLEADNSKAYFTATRAVFDEAVRGPLELLVDELAGEFGDAKIFRPYRDVRFTTDKSPYKTNAAAVAGGDGARIYYVEVSADGLLAASGYYRMARDQLERCRAAIDDERDGTALERIVDDLEGDQVELMGETLKTAPRGFRRDHPRIRLLRHTSLVGHRRELPGHLLHTSGAREWVAQTWRAADPLNEWLERHVGPSRLPAR